MSDIDVKLYDAMGQRFAVVKVIEQIYQDGKIVEGYKITTSPNQYFDSTVIATKLRYSEAQGIVKLLGEENGTS